MTTYTLNKYFGGTQEFSVGQLESVLTHLAASVQNEAQSSGVVYKRGEPGLLVADTSSPIVRTLMYSYSTQPSLDFTPPIAFLSGETAVSLTAALLSSGALIPEGQSLEDTLANNNMFFYNGQNPFEGPPGVQGEQGIQGSQGPAPTAEEVASSVSAYLTSADGTSTLTPLISSSTTTWLTDNQSALVSTVPGPQGPAPTAEEVASSVTSYLTSTDGTSTLTPLISSSATAWLIDNQSALVSTVPGPQGLQGDSVVGPMGQPGIGEVGPRGASVVSASVDGTDIVFLMSDSTTVTVPIGSVIDTALDAYLADNPPAGGVSSVSVSSSGALTLTMSDSSVVSGDLTTYVNEALATLPAPISGASLSGTILTLTTSSDPITVDLVSLSGSLASASLSGSTLLLTNSNSTAVSVDLSSLSGGGSSVDMTPLYQRPWYNFDPKAGARQTFMYTSSLNSYSASGTWKVETWIRLRSAVLNGYGTVLDTRSYPGAGGSNWLIFFVWGGSNGNFPGIWTPSGGQGITYDAAPFVKTNDWSHVVWQCSPSTGLQILVDGVLAQTLSSQTFGVASHFSFGNVVDQVSNVGNWALRLNADVSQLLVRVGPSVPMYTNGYTPPQSLSFIAQNASDTVYCMPKGFRNMTLPANQVIDEYF